jgi:hypothetical protein
MITSTEVMSLIRIIRAAFVGIAALHCSHLCGCQTTAIELQWIAMYHQKVVDRDCDCGHFQAVVSPTSVAMGALGAATRGRA